MTWSVRRTCAQSVLLLLSLGCAEQVQGGEPLEGQADPEVDVLAVQEAVSGGGTVRLTGTFDFGETGQVVIDTDVAILGEGATILGGEDAFTCDDPGVELSIEALQFGRHPAGVPVDERVDGPRNRAIWIRRAARVELVDNAFWSVQPVYDPSLDRHFGAAILLGDTDGFGGAEPDCMEALVAGNEIDLGLYSCDQAGEDCVQVDPTVPIMSGSEWVGQDNLFYGIGLFRASFDAAVIDNRVRNCTRTGLYAIDIRGHAAIVGNDVACGEYGGHLHEWPGMWPLNYGMVIHSSWFDLSARGASEYLVAHNAIAVSNAMGMGMVAQVDHSFLFDNEIDLTTPGAGVFGLWTDGGDDAVVGNRIHGDGAVGILFDTASPASGNLIAANDLSEFTAWWSQLDLGGLFSDGLIVGNLFGDAGEQTIRVGGDDNLFLSNLHTGTPPGWMDDGGAWTGSGYWHLCGGDSCPDWYPTSHRNVVLRPILPHGTDPQAQWRDHGEDNLLLP